MKEQLNVIVKDLNKLISTTKLLKATYQTALKEKEPVSTEDTSTVLDLIITLQQKVLEKCKNLEKEC